jgi:hypothetical protein
MIKLSLSKHLFTTAIILALFTGSTVFSQKKSDQPLQKGGVKLEYNFPAAKTVKYISVNISMTLGCQVKSAGKQGENLNLEISVDTMGQNVESPQGSAGGPISDVIGKVFTMVISPSGKVVDLSGASKIVYTVEGSGESTLNQSFMNYFPVLPKNAVKEGDTWISNDTLDSKAQSNTIWMPVEANYKFEGIEKIDGIDCAKISSTLSGTRKMTTKSQGMEIRTSGPFTGTQTLFFAVNEGYFIKQIIVSKMTGNIEIPDQNMSFPVVMTINSTNQIVK